MGFHRNKSCFATNESRTFEDLFPQDLYIEAFNKYCDSINSIGVFQENYVHFAKKEKEKITSPIIDTLKEHFYSFIIPENRAHESISKQDVMRHLFLLVEKMDTVKKNESLSKLNELVALIDKKAKKISS